MIDIEKTEREIARWRILRALDAGRPLPLDEQKILYALSGAHVELSLAGLRRELDYLHDGKLVEVTGRKSPLWDAHLTHFGINVVEYAIDCPPGIARPPKW